MGEFYLESSIGILPQNAPQIRNIFLLGHSMGGGMSFCYTVTHPEHIKKLIMLDAMKPISRNLDVLVSRTRASVDDLLNIELKLASGKQNAYSYEQALKRLLDGSHQIHGQESITMDSAKILLKRGLKKASEGENEDVWEFTRDLKHRIASLYGYPQEVMRTFATEVKCPHLIVKANNGRLYENEAQVNEVLDLYRTTNPHFDLVTVEGNHHVHLNEPQNVWPAIDAFLAKND
jgi:pimeloyl-ACP methyl ester carboxylesterase